MNSTANNGGGSSDLIAGIAAAICLVVFVFALHFTPLLGVPLAVATYFGVRMLVPQPAPVEADPPSIDGKAIVANLRGLALKLPYPTQQHTLTSICETADQLLVYLTAHPDRSLDAESLVNQYLNLTQTAVNRFTQSGLIDVKKSEASAGFDDMLNNVNGRFTSLFNKLMKDDDVELASELKVLNQTMKDMDTLTVGVSGDGT